MIGETFNNARVPIPKYYAIANLNIMWNKQVFLKYQNNFEGTVEF